MVLDVVKALVATGRTKMIVAVCSIAAMYHLSTLDKLDWPATAGIVLVTAMFLFARKLQEKEEWSVKRADQDRANLPPYETTSSP